MTDLIKLATELANRIEWQLVPEDLDIDDCVEFIIRGIRTLYIQIGEAAAYSDDLLILDENDKPVSFARAFILDEEEYILVSAMIDFYSKVQSDVSELESYTTDAMAVANADKPFANLASMLDKLRSQQNKIWYKMVRYNSL